MEHPELGRKPGVFISFSIFFLLCLLCFCFVFEKEMKVNRSNRRRGVTMTQRINPSQSQNQVCSLPSSTLLFTSPLSRPSLSLLSSLYLFLVTGTRQYNPMDGEGGQGGGNVRLSYEMRNVGGGGCGTRR